MFVGTSAGATKRSLRIHCMEAPVPPTIIIAKLRVVHLSCRFLWPAVMLVVCTTPIGGYRCRITLLTCTFNRRPNFNVTFTLHSNPNSLRTMCCSAPVKTGSTSHVLPCWRGAARAVSWPPDHRADNPVVCTPLWCGAGDLSTLGYAAYCPSGARWEAPKKAYAHALLQAVRDDLLSRGDVVAVKATQIFPLEIASCCVNRGSMGFLSMRAPKLLMTFARLYVPPGQRLQN